MASSVKRVTNLVATWSMKAKQASSQPARAFAAAAAPAEALHTAEPTINVNLSAAVVRHRRSACCKHVELI